MVTNHTEQPPPIPRSGVASVQSFVRADLEARERLGIQRYGTPLQPHNGRDALRDAYEEALDLSCYLRQAIAERGEVRDDELRAELDALRAEVDMAAALRKALREELDGPELTDKQLVDEVRHGVRACELLHQIREIAAGVDWLGEPVVEAHICCEHAR